ncbi:MAG: serine/threonine-protein kinase [Myxococcota bacterium]
MEVAPGKPPRFLGPYELLARIGTGGMAVVYLARRTGESGFSRLFALKVLHPHLGEDAEHLSMLLEEARVAARLHHVNVVPVVDLGHDRGFHYIVLDYVEGCSLVSLLRRSRDARPPRLVAAVVLDVLAGLHAAHTLEGDDGVPFQLVHRDVTPHNVLVAADGNAHLTDFGIVRIRAAGRAHETVAGQLKGKMHYLSPEQVRGDPIDRRSDIFSAGALLWSALKGRSLFRGENDGATLHNILEAPITPASRVGHRPPAELDEVMVRALERDPTARFATAREMDEALREALRPLGGPATRREVAEWVAARFGTELAERREAVRRRGRAPRVAARRRSGGAHGHRGPSQFVAAGDGCDAGLALGNDPGGRRARPGRRRARGQPGPDDPRARWGARRRGGERRSRRDPASTVVIVLCPHAGALRTDGRFRSLRGRELVASRHGWTRASVVGAPTDGGASTTPGVGSAGFRRRFAAHGRERGRGRVDPRGSRAGARGVGAGLGAGDVIFVARGRATTGRARWGRHGRGCRGGRGHASG